MLVTSVTYLERQGTRIRTLTNMVRLVWRPTSAYAVTAESEKSVVVNMASVGLRICY